MSEIKVGDRVRVEFDGTVEDTIGVPAREVFINDGDNSLWTAASHCTVIVPPIAVGDYVHGNNIQQLGERSVIAPDGSAGWIKVAGSWHFGDQEMAHHEVIVRGDFRVLRIGGGESQ